MSLPLPPEILFIVLVALAFDYSNGVHDAANSIATVVATRVLKPWQAVLWAASFNFLAFLIMPLAVANAIAKIVSADIVSIGLVFAGLMGAIVWNVITAMLGLPSSSSHALIGGMVGAGFAKVGMDVFSENTVNTLRLWRALKPRLPSPPAPRRT